jgi:hypothetical protein
MREREREREQNKSKKFKTIPTWLNKTTIINQN